jgi:HEAT repeat protein
MSRAVVVFCLTVLIALPSVGVARQQTQNQKIAELIEKLGDDSYDVREEAQKKLEKIGEPARVALVKATKTHTDLEVRKRARKALEKQIAELIEKLGDDSYEVREETQKKLEKIGEPARDALVKAKRHTDLEVRNRARRTLAAIKRIEGK